MGTGNRLIEVMDEAEQNGFDYETCNLNEMVEKIRSEERKTKKIFEIPEDAPF